MFVYTRHFFTGRTKNAIATQESTWLFDIVIIAGGERDGLFAVAAMEWNDAFCTRKSENESGTVVSAECDAEATVSQIVNLLSHRGKEREREVRRGVWRCS